MMLFVEIRGEDDAITEQKSERKFVSRVYGKYEDKLSELHEELNQQMKESYHQQKRINNLETEIKSLQSLQTEIKSLQSLQSEIKSLQSLQTEIKSLQSLHSKEQSEIKEIQTQLIGVKKRSKRN